MARIFSLAHRRSRAANERGREAMRARALDDAERALREAARLWPENVDAWHNLGIVMKWQRRWPEAADATRRVLALDPDDEGSAWNLGIAATALGDWAGAREGWARAGIAIPAGQGPLEMKLGLVPIRCDPEGAAEVIWSRRIDPARAILQNVPTSPGRRFGDLVLHDGSANGHRRLGEVEVPVFDELCVLEPSAWSTFECEVEAPAPADAEALDAIVGERIAAVEDWTASVRVLCKACSEGRPHAGDHAHEAREEWTPERRLGVAASDAAAVRAALAEWAAAGDGRRVGRVELLVEGVVG